VRELSLFVKNKEVRKERNEEKERKREEMLLAWFYKGGEHTLHWGIAVGYFKEIVS
jgi:hypothetical protein